MEILCLIIGLLLGVIGTYIFLRQTGNNIVTKAKTDAEQITRTAQLEAETKAKEIELAAAKKQMNLKAEFERGHYERWEKAGIDQLMLLIQTGHTTHDQIMRSIELFGEKVLPRFKESGSGAVAQS